MAEIILAVRRTILTASSDSVVMSKRKTKSSSLFLSRCGQKWERKRKTVCSSETHFPESSRLTGFGLDTSSQAVCSETHEGAVSQLGFFGLKECSSSCRTCLEVQGLLTATKERLLHIPGQSSRESVSQSASQSVQQSAGLRICPSGCTSPESQFRLFNHTMDSWTVTSALLLAGVISSAAFNHFDTECYTANGEDYRGFQNQTSLHGGKPCLFWNETFQHPYNTLKYPNGEGGLGRHNYCRNPDGDVQPWCYIADHEDGIYWRYCDIPTCQMPGNLGCFKDSGDPPTLSGTSETSNKLTIQNCISFCRKQRYKLAGMESGYACFCGNEVDPRDHGE
ncbi:Kremen protein 1, partial [Larimichthys crocea]